MKNFKFSQFLISCKLSISWDSPLNTLILFIVFRVIP
jgi:hypothetical protein